MSKKDLKQFARDHIFLKDHPYTVRIYVHDQKSNECNHEIAIENVLHMEKLGKEILIVKGE